ncbi:6-carboxy-5,6,7,8-tetrahydropterin synthase [Legionella israelensis]|uniref:6-carboxy-5,6,7,8-tetrahydropterin synthase n=1 Tax=Legionella israelensis TaxID=454 RepID=A0AAX1ECU6_9GAMM|nr:6-carboxytetrahydropterin synthase [Legionella israelensis]QBR82931.1 6-carboxy-5,6,7,8-tetrahydropterin synthase [Legionella israelensis]QDP71555.1 6-carboxy-5,6,7,8-tetrahydropterin synthase [Legionella israelensis]
MSYRITKLFKLDMGHRTWSQDMRKGRGKEFYMADSPYPYNKCANIHGHSLIISITLGSNTLDQQNFVMDTDLFKIPFQKRIIDQMDHSFVIDKNDPLFNDFKTIASKDNLRLYVVDFSPSFEALAEFFFNCMNDIIKEVSLEKEINIIEAKVTGEHMTVEAVYNKTSHDLKRM